jgi:hypothetical protein
MVLARVLRAPPRCSGAARSALARDPRQDRARVSDDRPVGQLERGHLRVSGRLPERVARALAQKRDRMSVGGDHLLVLDPLRTQSFLHAATRMYPWAAVIAMAHIQGRRWGHCQLLLQLPSMEDQTTCLGLPRRRAPAPVDRGTVRNARALAFASERRPARAIADWCSCRSESAPTTTTVA